MLIYPIKKRKPLSHHHANDRDDFSEDDTLLGYILTGDSYCKKYIILHHSGYNNSFSISFADYLDDKESLTISTVRLMSFLNGAFCDVIKSNLVFDTVWDMLRSQDQESVTLIKDILNNEFQTDPIL